MSNTTDILIKNGRVIDPVNGRDGILDVLIANGRIVKVEKTIHAKPATVINACGMIVAPGLIDMHVHLREPGREDIETVASGTRAAIAGGITAICAMPNTCPAIDSYENVRNLQKIVQKDARVSVFITASITKDRKGERLVDFKKLKKAGASAFSDDGSAIQKKSVMARALKRAKAQKALLICHCEDERISKNGVVNEGIIATKLGLRGIPKEAEYTFVKRDIEIAKRLKARAHIAHVSCGESVAIIRKAKRAGVAVTAETAPHYFSLYDSCCVTYDTRTKINPPLRSAGDVEAITEGIADGTIDVIASDHAPHGKHEKEVEFDAAAFGIIGLETSLALSIMHLVDTKKISWRRLIEMMSVNPARILGCKKKGALTAGSDADITIIDAEKEWRFTKDIIASKSKNSPFIDWELKGRATDVIIGGTLVMAGGACAQRRLEEKSVCG